jgi:hypothetical protein
VATALNFTAMSITAVSCSDTATLTHSALGVFLSMLITTCANPHAARSIDASMSNMMAMTICWNGVHADILAATATIADTSTDLFDICCAFTLW